MSRTFMMPAGEYYIGDPQAVFTSAVWDEIVDVVYGADGFDKAHTFQGHPFCALTTKNGDGLFPDNKGREYPVDTGMIGAISRAIVESQGELSQSDGDLRQSDGVVAAVFVKFEKDFECDYHKGFLHFGNISIDTNSYPDPEYDERENDLPYFDTDESAF